MVLCLDDSGDDPLRRDVLGRVRERERDVLVEVVVGTSLVDSTRRRDVLGRVCERDGLGEWSMVSSLGRRQAAILSLKRV